MADTKPKKMTDEELAEAKRAASAGDSSEAGWTTEWGAKVFAHIAALTTERDKLESTCAERFRLAEQQEERAVRAERERDALQAQGQADHRAVHDALGWAHNGHFTTLPEPWRGVTALIRERDEWKRKATSSPPEVSEACSHREAELGCASCSRRVRTQYPEFPLQVEPGALGGPLTIPWAVAERAWAEYWKRYGARQSVERLAQRGGFGWGEMDAFLPGWRDAVDEFRKLRERVMLLEVERDGWRERVRALEQVRNAAESYRLEATPHVEAGDGSTREEALVRACAIADGLSGEADQPLSDEDARRICEEAGIDTKAQLAKVMEMVAAKRAEQKHVPNPPESAPPLDPDAAGEADQPVEGVSNSPSNPEPTTAEAFAAVREIVDGMAEGEEYRTGREVLRKELALLERRMERYTLAARMVVDATNDAQDMDEDLLAARLAAKAALTDAPPVFTPSVPGGLAALIDGFAAEVQAAEDHAQRPKGGQQVTPPGDFVRCTPSMLGRLRWWVDALREGRTAVPVFTLEEIRKVFKARLHQRPLADAMKELAALRT